METIDFNVSNEKEAKAVGFVKYFTGESVFYDNETKMLRAYKDVWNTVGMSGINYYTVFDNKPSHRHGLKYELIKEQYNQLGLEYLKLDYIRDCAYSKKNRDNRDLDTELVK